MREKTFKTLKSFNNLSTGNGSVAKKGLDKRRESPKEIIPTKHLASNLHSIVADKEIPRLFYLPPQEELANAIREILLSILPQIVPELMKREEDKLISSKEARELLSISATTLWRMEKAALIQSVGAGKHKRYKYKSIMEYLAGGPV